MNSHSTYDIVKTYFKQFVLVGGNPSEFFPEAYDLQNLFTSRNRKNK